MKTHLFWRKILFTIAVFCLTVLGLRGLDLYRQSRYPLLTFTDMSALGLSDTEFTDNGRFLALGSDGYVELQGLKTCVRSVEVNCAWISRKPSFEPGVMQIYYNTGGGYTEENSVRVKIKNGSCRAVFETADVVHTIRFDLFDVPGNSVTVKSIVLNPSNRGNAAVVCIFAAAVFAVLCLFALYDTFAAHAVLSVFAAVFLIASGLPVIYYNNGQIRTAYFVIAGLGFAVAACAIGLAESRRKRAVFTLLLMVFMFALCYTWALISPVGQGPDESMHLDVVHFVAKYHTLPRGDDPRIRNEIWGFSYAFSPILPFILGGWFENIASLFSDEPHFLLMAARLVSILSGCGMVYFVSRASFLLFPDSKAGYMFPVFAAAFPEAAFMFTYVNSDGFALMTTAMIFYFWVTGIRYSWRIRDGVGLSVAMGLCALTYYNCYGFILMSIPLFFFSIFRTDRSRSYILRLTGLIVLLTALFCGWWFLRNAILYHGDFLGRRTLNETAELYALKQFKPSNISTPYKEGKSLTDMIFGMGWLKNTFGSFICMFSHYVLPGRILIARIFKRYFAIGGAGALICMALRVRGWKKRSSQEVRKTVLNINTAFAGVIPLILALLYSYSNDYQPQGRYILPCLVPLGYFLTVGADTLGRLFSAAFGKAVPKAGKSAGIAVRELFSCAGITVSICCIVNVFFDTVFSFYI